MLKNTHMAAIVNEGAFVDNLKDIQDWNEDAELKTLGIAYAKAAAEFLGLEEKKVEPVTAGKLYRVQVGAYSERKNAETAVKKLKAAGFDAIIV